MIYAFGDYELDTQLYELRHAGQPCALEPQVFDILMYLIAHRDRVVSKDDLIAHVWPEPFVNDATLHQRVTAARRAVGDSGRTQGVIKTLRGRGYRFIARLQERQTTPAPQQSPAVSSALLRALPGERKIVTVLSGMLANTTALAERFGLADLPRLRQRFLTLVQQELQQYDGTFQPVGDDGFLALFGAPLAQEDHARRAVLAALALQHRLRAPYTDADTPREVAFSVRLGVHTGAVLVGGHLDAAQQPATLVGEATTLAVQLQHQAEPGMLLVSENTLQWLPEETHSQRFGVIPLAGQAPPLMAHTIQRLGQWRPPRRQRHASTLTRFVGREREIATLRALQKQAEHGQGHVVGIMGEPGMGKSRLLYEFVQSLTNQAVTYLEGHCLPYGSTTPYLPVLDVLRQRCGLIDTHSPGMITAKIAQCLAEVGMTPAESAPYLYELLGLSEGPEPLRALSPQTLKHRMFAALHQLFLRSSQRQPLVIAVENLHWIDPTSEAWLLELVEHLAQAPLLLITTYRPGYRPLWMAKSYTTQLALTPLTPEDSRAVVQSVLQRTRLSNALLHEILRKASGNPFFLEELTRVVAEGGGIQAALEVPDRVQAVLAARIDRLPAAAKHLLQIASVIGKDVPIALFQAVANVSETMFQHHLMHLQNAEFLYEIQSEPHRTYTFKHALTRDVAYQSLLLSTRQQLHEQVAQVLTERCSETTDRQPELLAHHYTEAGLSTPAMRYWQRAGQRAIERSAHVEAIAHLTKGLELVKSLQDTPERAQQELTWLMALSVPLTATKGTAALDVGAVYTRARELCRHVGEPLQLFTVLWGLRLFYTNRGEYRTAQELGEDLMSLAQRAKDPALLLQAHRALGATLLYRGEFAAARAHAEQQMTLYDPQQYRNHAFLYGQDPGVIALVIATIALWSQGYPDQALTRSCEALALAQKVSHPFSLAFALLFRAWLHQYRREGSATQTHAEAVMALSHEQDFVEFFAMGTILRGWALVEQGQEAQGLAQVQQGLASYQATGAVNLRPFFLGLLNVAYSKTGHIEAGLRALAEGLAAVYKHGQHFYAAELYRLTGALLLKQPIADKQQAETYLHQALDIARRQQAKSWELRAAMSLSRLWQLQGKSDAARQLLAETYSWFTEGFTTADLQEAKALLDALAA